jgi:alkyl hydroperoxide reductase subunit AhpC
VIRAYGVFNERTLAATRTFFLIDPQGKVRRKWLIENSATTVVYSDTVLRDIQEVIAKP